MHYLNQPLQQPYEAGAIFIPILQPGNVPTVRLLKAVKLVEIRQDSHLGVRASGEQKLSTITLEFSQKT